MGGVVDEPNFGITLHKNLPALLRSILDEKISYTVGLA